MTTIREQMTKDFRVFDAGWPPERALLAVAKSGCAYVVFIEWAAHDNTRYFVLPRAEALRVLASEAPTVGHALVADETLPAATVSCLGEFEPRGGFVILLEEDRPAWLIAPDRTTRGRSDELALESFQPEVPASIDESPQICKLVAEFPERMTMGATAPLVVALDLPEGPTTVSAEFTQPESKEVEVAVEPIKGLSLVGEARGKLNLDQAAPGPRLEFRLKADAPGRASVRVRAFSDRMALVSFPLTTFVEEATTAAAPEASNQTVARRIEHRTPPDLAMYIFEQGNQLSFRLQSANGQLQMQQFGPVNLIDPKEHFRAFFKDIERLRVDTPEQQQIARRRLEAQGSNLFERVFPNDLKALLWSLRKQVTSVQVTSDEPWIPWEVCRLKSPPGERGEEGRFFAEAFDVTRWLAGAPAATRLRLKNWAVVVPGDSGLSFASEEKKHLLTLSLPPTRTVTDVPARFIELTDAMAGGRYDVWHFCGHARADADFDADRSCIDLEERLTLTPADLAGAPEAMLGPRPLVFLNACQSAQGGLSLTGVGGWARRLLSPGSGERSAAGFVGTYWSIDDRVAYNFAKAFYASLLGGEPIGRATRRAREAVRTGADPSWLAYTVYADPSAVVAAD